MAKTMKSYGPAAMHAAATTAWTTAGTGCITKIGFVTIINTGGSTRTVQVSFGTLGATTYLINESLAPGATLHRYLGQHVQPSVTVQEAQGSGTDCTITISYEEFAAG